VAAANTMHVCCRPLCTVTCHTYSNYQAFVYGSDLVPRLLGSPLPLLHQAAGR
jgi:hypothetical protein